jgi:hypothetical protein
MAYYTSTPRNDNADTVGTRLPRHVGRRCTAHDHTPRAWVRLRRAWSRYSAVTLIPRLVPERRGYTAGAWETVGGDGVCFEESDTSTLDLWRVHAGGRGRWRGTEDYDLRSGAQIRLSYR